MPDSKFLACARAHHRYTWKEYLSLERHSDLKHEFLDGEIFAIAGGTPEHAALAAAVIGQLFPQMEGQACRVFSSDLSVRVSATGLATYPDATVVCGELERDRDDKNVILNPKVLVEVTSPSSEEYDRGEKFEHYRQISTLREYVLISHRECLIEVLRRGEGDQWTRTEARMGGSVKLESVQAELWVDRIFDGIGLADG